VKINCSSCNKEIHPDMSAAFSKNCCPYCDGPITSEEAMKLKGQIVHDLSKIELTAEKIANLFIYKYLDGNFSVTEVAPIVSASKTNDIVVTSSSSEEEEEISVNEISADDIEAARLLEEGNLDEFFGSMDSEQRASHAAFSETLSAEDVKTAMQISKVLPQRGSSRRLST